MVPCLWRTLSRFAKKIIEYWLKLLTGWKFSINVYWYWYWISLVSCRVVFHSQMKNKKISMTIHCPLWLCLFNYKKQTKTKQNPSILPFLIHLSSFLLRKHEKDLSYCFYFGVHFIVFVHLLGKTDYHIYLCAEL